MTQSVKTNSLHLCNGYNKNIGHNLDTLDLNFSAKDGCGGQKFSQENLPSTPPFSKWSDLFLQSQTRLKTLSANSSAAKKSSFETSIFQKENKNYQGELDYSFLQKKTSLRDVNVLLQRCNQFHNSEKQETLNSKRLRSLFQREIMIQDKTVLG